jgi:predicted Rossmann fold flavoprotein
VSNLFPYKQQTIVFLTLPIVLIFPKRMQKSLINHIAIIGGGAAGFFAAISAKENYPGARVVIFEKSKKLLSKVKVSGGGRCNLTNSCASVSKLCDAYPRGGKSLKKLFPVFGTHHAMEWFKLRGVPLVVQDDGCVFPASQDSQSIIDCFMRESKRLGIHIETGCGIKTIRPIGDSIQLHFSDENKAAEVFQKVIVATGGSHKLSGLDWLESLGHRIESPVPSLFSFNMPNENITKLMGIVIENTLVSIRGTKTKAKATGALLITHWGMSGPAILKLSSFGARLLNETKYLFAVQVNWVNEPNSELVLSTLGNISKEHGTKLLSNYRPYSLPDRLWQFLLEKSELPKTKRWNELGRKGINKLMDILTNDVYNINGKSTFKEEFVTCGGVSLQSIEMRTMQSKVVKNLYFAGEVLDIDAITGGFNLQAAWTTGFVAGKLMD